MVASTSNPLLPLPEALARTPAAPRKRYCAACGSEAQPGAKFCANCGTATG